VLHQQPNGQLQIEYIIIIIIIIIITTTINIIIIIIIIISSSSSIIIIIISCHRFSFFPGTSALEPVVNPTTQASSLSL
jgi:hypothetical protein